MLHLIAEVVLIACFLQWRIGMFLAEVVLLIVFIIIVCLLLDFLVDLIIVACHGIPGLILLLWILPPLLFFNSVLHLLHALIVYMLFVPLAMWLVLRKVLLAFLLSFRLLSDLLCVVL